MEGMLVSGSWERTVDMYVRRRYILDNFCGSSLRSPCVCASRSRSIEYRVTVCVDTFKPQRENRFEFRVDVRQCELLHEMNRERLPLLLREANSNLSLLFATLCVIDIFGVFPIIALPRAIVECGKFFFAYFAFTAMTDSRYRTPWHSTTLTVLRKRRETFVNKFNKLA